MPQSRAHSACSQPQLKPWCLALLSCKSGQRKGPDEAQNQPPTSLFSHSMDVVRRATFFQMAWMCKQLHTCSETTGKFLATEKEWHVLCTGVGFLQLVTGTGARSGPCTTVSLQLFILFLQQHHSRQRDKRTLCATPIQDCDSGVPLSFRENSLHKTTFVSDADAELHLVCL